MITQYESPISKVNIKSLYIGNHWDLYSDKFKITNSTYTDICVRGIGLESNTANDFFTSSEIEDTHFMVVSGDMDNSQSVQYILTFAQKFKSLNKDGVLIAVMLDSNIKKDSSNTLKEIFDHIVFIEDNDFLSYPLKIIDWAFQEGFISIDFLDIRDLFKKYKFSAWSTAGCKDVGDVNEFLDSWIILIKNYCNNIGLKIQGMLVNLSLDGERGNLEIAETVFSSFAKMIDNKDCEFLPIGQFNSKDSIVEISVLAMANEYI